MPRLTTYFDGRIHGALEHHTAFSKKMLIDRLYREHDLNGHELAAFGDGYVEIEVAKAVGDLAIGVASRENGQSGWDSKKNRLHEAGADVLVPDWLEANQLLNFLLDSETSC